MLIRTAFKKNYFTAFRSGEKLQSRSSFLSTRAGVASLRCPVITDSGTMHSCKFRFHCCFFGVWRGSFIKIVNLSLQGFNDCCLRWRSDQHLRRNGHFHNPRLHVSFDAASSRPSCEIWWAHAQSRLNSVSVFTLMIINGTIVKIDL